MKNYICINGQQVELTQEQVAKLVAEGKLKREKFDASYGAWKNHISHGNCYHMGVEMDRKIEEVLGNEESIERKTG